jgi:uncharacterized protein YqeY
MGLKEQISEEIKAAMKMPDKTRLETLRTLRAVLMEREIEKRGSGTGVTPDDEMAVMMSAAKKRKESIEQFEKGGRPELAEQERKELAIIQEYLPKQLLAGDIETIVDQVMKDIGASGPGDFGKLMPAVMKHLKGKADGRVIQDIVKKKLGAA